MLNFYPPVQAVVTINPVPWNGSTDRVLQVGQWAQITAAAATSIPLHIACGDGQVYELTMNGTFTPAAAGASTLLLINNATLAGNFNRSRTRVVGASTLDGLNSSAADTGFLLSIDPPDILKATIWTTTIKKGMIVDSYGRDTTNTVYSWHALIYAADTTTPYSSLGTVILPNAWTGQIVARRVA